MSIVEIIYTIYSVYILYDINIYFTYVIYYILILYYYTNTGGVAPSKLTPTPAAETNTNVTYYNI